MLRRSFYRTTVTTLTVAATLAVAGPAYAAAPGNGPYPLPVIIDNITAWTVGLAFGVGCLFATIGAARRMAANGDSQEIEKSNAAFKNAAYGYALAVLSPILLAIVKGWIGG